MRNIITTLLVLLTITGFITKNKDKLELTTTTTTTIEQKKSEIDEKDILEVFNKLVVSIKDRNMDGIASCYTDDAVFQYDSNTNNKFSCFNNHLSVNGVDSIIDQYKFMIKKRILDNIEFEVYAIDKNEGKPMLMFINAWQNSDYDVEERIFFKKVNGKYKIYLHLIGKKL